MRNLLVVLGLAISMTSCTYDCVGTTYVNGAFYDETTWTPFDDGGCYCTDYSRVSANGDRIEYVCTVD